ncbi:MAG TPA: discoidin domain-containing protein [Polyangiaceae bacterium]|jgi:hypothetical protein|nr:discoidin domain-containing protein [Polyangiaceae bacterium]
MTRFPRRVFDALRASFAPEGAVDVGALPPADRARFFTYYDAARARLDGAATLGESGQAVPALLLYREGFSMLARAHSVTGAGVAPAEDLVVEQFIEWLASKHAPSARALRADLVAPDGPLDTASLRELALRVAELGAVTSDVVALLTPRSSEEQKRRRTVRNALIVAGLVASLGAIAVEFVRPENIALHRPTKASSHALGTRPSGAVNGRIYEQYGFHSEKESSAWWRVDLEQTYAVTRIRVYGRHDCCFDQSIPMVVEVSNDGDHFHQIAGRVEAFDQLEPWEITPDEPVKTRFIRVRSLKDTNLVLTEVEVYGSAVGR